jgi:hypothetical protein
LWVSGLSCTIPNGTVAPGKVCPWPEVPIIGLTHAVSDSTAGGLFWHPEKITAARISGKKFRFIILGFKPLQTPSARGLKKTYSLCYFLIIMFLILLQVYGSEALSEIKLTCSRIIEFPELQFKIGVIPFFDRVTCRSLIWSKFAALNNAGESSFAPSKVSPL